jgi:hypothetical protein
LGHEVATHARFGQSVTTIVSLVMWQFFFENAPLELCFLSSKNLISLPSSLPKYPQKKCASGIDSELSNGVEASDLPIQI